MNRSGIALLVICACISLVWGESSSFGRTVHVGMYQNEPKIFVDSAGNPAGIFPEILAEIARREQWKIIYHKGTWDQCLSMLEQGRIDLMPDVAYSEKRDSLFDFPAKEVLVSWSTLYASKGVTVRSMADLKGKRIAVVKGSIQHTYLSEQLIGFGFAPTFVEVSAFQDAYRAVANGEADLLATNHLSGDYFYDRYNLQKTALAFNPSNLHFAVAQGKNGDLIAAIESAILSMKSTPDSPYYRALERWTFTPNPVLITPALQILFAVTGSLLALAILFILILRWQVRQAVAEQKRSAAQLQGISDNLVNGFVYQVLAEKNSPNRRFLYLSAGVERVLGISAKAACENAQSLYRLIHPDDILLLAESEQDAIATLSVFQCESRFIRPDGEERWLFLTSTPHLDSDGNVIGDGMALDITERHRTEEALIESERYTRALFNESPIGLALCKMDGTLLDVNPAYCKIVGYTSHELKTLTYWELTPREYESQEQAQLECMKRTGRYGPFEKEYIHKDGHRVPVSLRGLIIEKDGERCIWSSIEDCTERNAVEKERKELQEQLFHSQKMDAIGKLVGGIAHDFNNTLGSISGAAELICSGVVEGDEVIDYAKMIVNAARRSGELTRKLLTFTRQIPHRRAPMILGTIVNETVMLIERTAGKSVAVTSSIPTDPLCISGDETMLQQVILNIGINGIHAMPHGGTLEIVLEEAELDQEFCEASDFSIEPGFYAKLSIRDTGTGMSQETLERMYEPFYTTKPFGQGNGLGLSTVYGTVMEHDGAIFVDSELDRGTTFTLYFPIAHHRTAAEPVSEIVRGSGAVMLVDDDENILKSVGGLLQSLGYTPLCLQSGPEAIDYLKDGNSVDLILLDMIMPSLSGRDTLERIRRFDSSTPVVIATGYSGEGADGAFAGLDVAGYLTKPFNRAELGEIVARCLKR